MKNRLHLQNLPPHIAHLYLDVARFTKEELATPLAGQSLLVGYSGGIDSTALLLVLYGLRQKYSLRLAAVHIDHNLRPTSGAEAQHCRRLCDELGIPFTLASVDVPALQKNTRTGLEEAARTARYQVYAQELPRTGSQYLVLGHHLNDLAEDVLMRLLRGTGWPGLGGMAGVDLARNLVRPLLLTPRQRLQEMLETLGISWVEDDSNNDMQYLRNRIRKDILPLFVGENPAFLEHVADLWRLGRLDSDFFAESLSMVHPAALVAPPTAPTEPKANISLLLPKEHVASLPKALRLRLYKEYVAHLGAGQALFSSLAALDAAFVSKKSGTIVQFPGGKRALLRSDGIVWEREK